MPGLVANLSASASSTGFGGGFINTRYLFEALALHNRTDGALRCLLRPGYPGFAHELYKHPEMRGYMDQMIGSRIPSMKDIQDLYEALEETPMREHLISVQNKIVSRFGEDC